MPPDLEAEYEQALRAAIDAAHDYLVAVARAESRRRLSDLATDARDLWASVATLCALGEDAARTRRCELPLRHWLRARQAAGVEAESWATRGEEASARCQMAGTLVRAHMRTTDNRRTSLRSLRSVEHDA